jgi:dTDP-glucose pyrophosphorylase
MKNSNISKLLIKENELVISSMKKLDSNKYKILFVVGEKDRLIGSLTDGDIRRWILGGKDLNEKVSLVCHKSPITLKRDFEIDTVKDLMLSNNIECIPVVSDDNIIEDVLFWVDLFKSDTLEISLKQLDVPVVIMAGGFGKRLEPFTTILPKPLIPVGDKSIVEHIIDKFLVHGIRNFHMTLNHKSKIVKSYFEDVKKSYDLKFVEEPKPLGTAGSLLLLKEELEDVFIVTNCDIMIYADYAEIVDFHVDNSYDITLVSSMMNYKIPYGICEIDTGGKLIELKEKPEYNLLISTGMYVLNKKILDYIPVNEVFHITHLMDEVKKHNGTVGVYPISEKSWDDTGEWDEYNKTVRRLTNDK